MSDEEGRKEEGEGRSEQLAGGGEQLGERRPNANYKLSNTNSQDGLHFYYNRERRLENSSEAVKGLYSGNKQMRFSLFGPLLADKPRRVLFVIVVFMCAGILALYFFGYFDTVYLLDGNKIDITATAFENNAIIIVKKTADKKDAYSGAVDIAVAPAESDNLNIFYHRVFFSMEKEEEYRFAVPFDDAELLMVLQNEKESLKLKIKPD